MQLDGLNVGAAFNGGGVSGNAYDVANAQEMQITLSGALGEAEVGGPILNIVPKTGGNTFQGTVFVTGAGSWAQGNNVDAALEAQGITEAAGLIKLWDVSGAMGGPIKRDKLWFFGNVRDFGNHTRHPGPLREQVRGRRRRTGTTRPIPQRQGRTATSKTIASVRLTSQVTPRNKVSFYYDYQWDCDQGGMNTDRRLPAARRRLGAGHRLRQRVLPGSEQQLLGRARNHLAGHLVVAGHQQAAPRSRLCDVRQPLGLDEAAGRDHRTSCR